MRIKRLLAIYIDYILACMIVVPSLSIIEIWISDRNTKYFIGCIFALIVLSFKDLLFKNRSLGKKLLNLDIISTDDKVLSKSILILRNFITVFIFPIEIIMILLFNRRIGDYIFNTAVITKTED